MRKQIEQCHRSHLHSGCYQRARGNETQKSRVRKMEDAHRTPSAWLSAVPISHPREQAHRKAKTLSYVRQKRVYDVGGRLRLCVRSKIQSINVLVCVLASENVAHSSHLTRAFPCRMYATTLLRPHAMKRDKHITSHLQVYSFLFFVCEYATQTPKINHQPSR